jgi:GT2 family glycosyltransferase
MEVQSNKIVSVIAVTRGVDNYIKGRLDSINGQIYRNLEIIVIDNSVNRNSSQEINKAYPHVKLYSSPNNLFYCEALNKEIEINTGDFILCLNDDIVLDKGFIKAGLRGFSLISG